LGGLDWILWRGREGKEKGGEKGLDVVSAQRLGGLAGFYSSSEAIRYRDFLADYRKIIS
jgi:hypothetical protein